MSSDRQISHQPDDRQIEPFDLHEYRGEIVRSHRLLDIEAMLVRLTDPGAAHETLHWGRNYIYSSQVETAEGPVDVVVKQFHNQGSRDRRRKIREESKATRSWRVACAMWQSGIPTPEPVVLIETKSDHGPSFFVTKKLEEVVEARYFFRALESDEKIRDFRGLDPERVLLALGRSIRSLHDAGIWHRDLSIGNVLLQPREDSTPSVYFVDLNRARLGKKLTTSRRTRDLCRLRIFQRHHQEIFLSSYWDIEPCELGWRAWLYRLYFHGFLTRLALKRSIRAPFTFLSRWILPRRPHAHIPPAPEGSEERDQVVWDRLSDQPHQHASRWSRVRVRVGDTRLHAKEAVVALAAIPRARQRYVELKASLYEKPIPWGQMGIALRPVPGQNQLLVEAIQELATRQVLLRLHPWEETNAEEVELARELHQRGFELTFVLPQNRQLVRDPEAWRSAIVRLGETFIRFGSRFQLGQAINRSKWGVWNHAEYLRLAQIGCEELRRYEGVELLGPAVIDYEPHRTLAMVNMPWPGVHFDALASLLYVDRRGAPENCQLGFDTVDKVVQMQAIAATARNCEPRSWITEVNWPLWEGPHSPAGRAVAVDEEQQANFLVRYYLLALGTGMVERVFWWQLVARGYGLSVVDPGGELRRRPSFRAFSTMARTLADSRFLGPMPTHPFCYLYRFQSTSGELLVAWSADDRRTQIELPRPVRRAVDRDGREMSLAGLRHAPVDGAPRYLWLDDA